MLNDIDPDGEMAPSTQQLAAIPLSDLSHPLWYWVANWHGRPDFHAVAEANLRRLFCWGYPQDQDHPSEACESDPSVSK